MFFALQIRQRAVLAFDLGSRYTFSNHFQTILAVDLDAAIVYSPVVVDKVSASANKLCLLSSSVEDEASDGLLGRGCFLIFAMEAIMTPESSSVGTLEDKALDEISERRGFLIFAIEGGSGRRLLSSRGISFILL